MKIKKKYHKYYLLSFAVIIIMTYSLLFANVLNLKKGPQKYVEIAATPTQQQKVYEEREYVSELGFKITVPEGYALVENFNDMEIVNIGSKGTIYLHRISTNYETVNEYVDDLEEKNHLNFGKKSVFIPTQYFSIATIEDSEKMIFIYPDKWVVYTFSTSSPELYGDLEKIVQSFEYFEK